MRLRNIAGLLLFAGAAVSVSTVVLKVDSNGEESIAAHHTKNGFFNPWPGFQKRGFTDFIKWMVERAKNGDKYNDVSYPIGRVDNDGSFLRYNRTDVTLTWVGHSTLLVQVDGINILTDPVWSERASPVQWAGPKRIYEPGLPFESLPEIDVVLITHDHYDHLDIGTIRRLGNKPLYVVPLGLGAFLEKQGITNVRELDWWDSVSYASLNISCTPAQHFSGRGLFDRNDTLWCGWAVTGRQVSLFYGGDTGYFPEFATIGDRYGPFDIVCLPIGSYLPKWFMGPVHLDPGEALIAFDELKGRLFVPVHWGSFILADDPLELPPAVLLKEIGKRGLTGDRYRIMKHGETLIVPVTDDVPAG